MTGKLLQSFPSKKMATCLMLGPLPLPGKLLEKIIHTKMMTFLTDNILLSDQQGSFRPVVGNPAKLIVHDRRYVCMQWAK